MTDPDLGPGWLMRSLLADPEYLEILRLEQELRDNPPPPPERVNSHEAINARIRRMLDGRDDGEDDEMTLV